MPTYEYECSRCGYKFEEFQSISAKSLTTCPKCEKKALARLIGTGAGLIFSALAKSRCAPCVEGGSAYGGKGSGFYATDYRKKHKEPEKGSCPAKKDESCSGCSLNKDE